MVLAAGRGRDRVDAGGVRQRLALRDQRRGRDLGHHEPRVEPRRVDQERRQPRLLRGHETRRAPLRDRRQIGQHDGRVVERRRHRRAVEVAPRDDAAVGQHHRVVGGRVDLDGELVAQVGERVAAGAVDLRGAAQAVGVLDAGAQTAEARASRSPGAEPQRAGAPSELAGVRPGLVDRRLERGVRALHGVHRHGGDDVGRGRDALGVDERQRRHRGHDLGAVDQRQPLLGRQLEALQPGPAQRLLAATPARPDSTASPSPISTSARCASGARSPEAPTDPCARHDRVDTGVEQVQQTVDHHRPGSGIAPRQDVRAQHQHRAHRVLGERLAHPAGVRAQQVALELGELRRSGCARRRGARTRC